VYSPLSVQEGVTHTLDPSKGPINRRTVLVDGDFTLPHHEWTSSRMERRRYTHSLPVSSQRCSSGIVLSSNCVRQ